MTPCPLCRGVLERQDAERGTVVFVPNPGGLPYLEHRRRPVVAVFCAQCEYVQEVTP